MHHPRLLSITVLNEKYSFPFRELAFPIGLSELLTSIMLEDTPKSRNLDIYFVHKMACVGGVCPRWWRSKMVRLPLSPQIHYGGSIQITSDNNIPSSSSHCECTKGAMIWRISKNTLTYPKEKIGVLTTSNCDLLQFVYRICSRITLTVMILFI